ncbi:MAG: aquaporin [Nitrospira sp.]|nr:aquaporin [Nitrospira sp.]
MQIVVDTMRRHWPEYLMEAAGLGLFMISAVLVTTLLEYPLSPFHELFPNQTIRRVVIGLAMGMTAIALIYSSWGKRSGAHLNPAVTVTFFRLGKIQGVDTACYMVAQFGGGLAGLLIGATVIGMAVEHPAVNYAVTVPGSAGSGAAFTAEVVMSFVLMLVILITSNRVALNPWTGVLAGCLVAAYISIEAPLSGMSMNPARSFASALPSHVWTGFWIYLTAPLIGMLLAAECYVRLYGVRRVLCAKLHHQNDKRCIFRCCYTS